MQQDGKRCRAKSGFHCLLSPLVLIFSLLLAMSLPATAQDAVERRALVDLTAPDNSEDLSTGSVTDLNARDEYDSSGLEPRQPLPPSIEMLPEADQKPETQAQSAAVEPPTSAIELLPEPDPLRIGLMAERGASYLQSRIAPFRSYLQDTLSRPVEIVAFSSVQALMTAHTSRQIDYASYPASVFAMAQASCGCLSPLVAPISDRAPDGIYMLLVVDGERGIQSLADMTGRTLALSSKSGALPFHVALNELRRSGLDPERDLTSLYSKETPAEALEMLEKGEVDAALVWSTTHLNQMLRDSRGAISSYYNAKKKRGETTNGQSAFVSIWRSRPVPAGPHVVHDQISKQDRADLVKALTAMNQRDPDAYDAIERYYGGGFKSVSLDDYAPLIEIATVR